MIVSKNGQKKVKLFIKFGEFWLKAEEDRKNSLVKDLVIGYNKYAKDCKKERKEYVSAHAKEKKFDEGKAKAISKSVVCITLADKSQTKENALRECALILADKYKFDFSSRVGVKSQPKSKWHFIHDDPILEICFGKDEVVAVIDECGNYLYSEKRPLTKHEFSMPDFKGEERFDGGFLSIKDFVRYPNATEDEIAIINEKGLRFLLDEKFNKNTGDSEFDDLLLNDDIFNDAIDDLPFESDSILNNGDNQLFDFLSGENKN